MPPLIPPYDPITPPTPYPQFPPLDPITPPLPLLTPIPPIGSHYPSITPPTPHLAPSSPHRTPLPRYSLPLYPQFPHRTPLPPHSPPFLLLTLHAALSSSQTAPWPLQERDGLPLSSGRVTQQRFPFARGGTGKRRAGPGGQETGKGGGEGRQEGRRPPGKERQLSGPSCSPTPPQVPLLTASTPPPKGFVVIPPYSGPIAPGTPRSSPTHRHRGFCSLTPAPAHLPSAPSPRCAPIGQAPKRREEIGQLESRRRRGGKNSANGSACRCRARRARGQLGREGPPQPIRTRAALAPPPGSHLLTERGPPPRIPLTLQSPQPPKSATGPPRPPLPPQAPLRVPQPTVGPPPRHGLSPPHSPQTPFRPPQLPVPPFRPPPAQPTPTSELSASFTDLRMVRNGPERPHVGMWWGGAEGSFGGRGGRLRVRRASYSSRPQGGAITRGGTRGLGLISMIARTSKGE